jgi:hypothetical protein
MNRVFKFACFGLGVLAVNTLFRMREGHAPPDLERPLKRVVRTWFTMRRAAAEAQAEFAAFQAETQLESQPPARQTRRRITVAGSQ